MTNLALGTVQFGLDYGIANQNGKISKDECFKILRTAYANKIHTLDTAPVYGDSEHIIGQFISEHPDHLFKVISKVKSNTIPEQILSDVEASIANLQESSLNAIMMHNADDLLDEQGDLRWQSLEKAKRQGMVKKIGVSVYSPLILKKIIDRYAIDIVQFPLNMIDQRFAQPEIQNLLKTKNVECHARSLFLQGVLLGDPNALPSYFDPYKDHLNNMHIILEDNKISKNEACFDFVHKSGSVDYAVVGVTSEQELLSNIQAFNKKTNFDQYSDFLCEDEKLFNPSVWG